MCSDYFYLLFYFFLYFFFFFFKQKTAYEMRISDWSSDVCSSDLLVLFCVITFSFTGISQQKIIPGAERMEQYLPLLKGKRIGLFANQTSVEIGRASCRERVCQYV